jgi:excisionase family DNA binding protein
MKIKPEPSHATAQPLLLSAPEIAKLCGVNRATIWRWTKAGVLPSPTIKQGRVVKWHRESIEAFARGEVAA